MSVFASCSENIICSFWWINPQYNDSDLFLNWRYAPLNSPNCYNYISSSGYKHVRQRRSREAHPLARGSSSLECLFYLNQTGRLLFLSFKHFVFYTKQNLRFHQMSCFTVPGMSSLSAPLFTVFIRLVFICQIETREEIILSETQRSETSWSCSDF